MDWCAICGATDPADCGPHSFESGQGRQHRELVEALLRIYVAIKLGVIFITAVIGAGFVIIAARM